MPTMDANQTTDQLRFALNELKAIGTDSELEADRKTCAIRLRNIASHIESGGDVPNIDDILRESLSLPIQQ